MKRKSIFVETLIEGRLDEVWKFTQQPDLHEQWDLRFSSISSTPEAQPGKQAFIYETKIGFGMKVSGWGRHGGSADGSDGSKTSSLQFGTDQSSSLIKSGSGYWKYIPQDKHVQFFTQYDYKTNFGRLGALFDLIVFRPLIGWATALSFDVLKRWIEKKETPSSQYLRFFCSWLIALIFLFIWTYHGLVPKLLFADPEELWMLQYFLPVQERTAYWLTAGIGFAELVFGIVMFLSRRKRNFYLLQMIAFPFLSISALIALPKYLAHPFSPITFHAALITLSIVGFLVSKDVPTARNCRRRRR